MRQIIEADTSLKVVAEADDGESALELIRASRPRVAVLDVDMPIKDGFAVARELERGGAGGGFDFPHHAQERALLQRRVRSRRAGLCAQGQCLGRDRQRHQGSRGRPQLRHPTFCTDYLLKRSRHDAHAAQQTGLGSLTEAERRVLKLIAEYKSSREIADELFISPRTVDRHRANIADKLDLKGTHALLHFALEHKTQL